MILTDSSARFVSEGFRFFLYFISFTSDFGRRMAFGFPVRLLRFAPTVRSCLLFLFFALFSPLSLISFNLGKNVFDRILNQRQTELRAVARAGRKRHELDWAVVVEALSTITKSRIVECGENQMELCHYILKLAKYNKWPIGSGARILLDCFNGRDARGVGPAFDEGASFFFFHLFFSFRFSSP